MKKLLYFIALIVIVAMFFAFPHLIYAFTPPTQSFCTIANDVSLTCVIPSPSGIGNFVSNGQYPSYISFISGAPLQSLGSFDTGSTVNLSTSDMVSNMANGDTATIFGYDNYVSSGSISSYDCSNPQACTIVANGSHFLDFPIGSFFSSYQNFQGHIVSIEDDTHLTLWMTHSPDNTGSIYIYPLTSFALFHKIDNTHWTTMAEGSSISITSPISGSTITDTATLLEGQWISIDSTIWTNLKIAFNDLQIGETSKIVNVPLTTDDGDFSIPLSDFEITKNGDWILRTIVENEYEYNFDVPNPIYGLTFNVEGLPTPYTFTDFDDWYTANVDNYETPSVWASSMVGFLQPIFEKAGEYGNRIESYLSVSDAYDKGNRIGVIFPTAQAYLNNINVFFGGFPLVPFFEFLIIVMLGIFIVRTIFKFIPFFG